MAITTLTKNGALSQDIVNELNANFASLSASTAGGSLTAAHLLVGNSLGVATDTAITGAIAISDAGVVTIPAQASLSQATLVTLSAADIIALHSAPKEIVAAPGSGKAVIVDSVTWSMTYGSVQFTGGGVVQCQYHTDTVNLLSTTVLDTSIKAAASFAVRIGAAATTNGVVLLANKAVELIAASADFAAGNSTAKVWVQYRVVTL